MPRKKSSSAASQKSAPPAGREIPRPAPASGGGFPEKASGTAGGGIVAAFLTPRRIILASLLLSVLFLLTGLAVHRRPLSVLRAERALEREDWPAALRHFRAAYGETPPDPRTHLTLARCLVGMDRSSEALRHLDAAEAGFEGQRISSQSRALLHGLRGRVFLDVGEKARAVQEAQKALQADASEPFANLTMGLYFQGENDLLQAGAFFGRLAGKPEYQAYLNAFKAAWNASALAVPDSAVEDVPEKAPHLQVVGPFPGR